MYAEKHCFMSINSIKNPSINFVTKKGGIKSINLSIFDIFLCEKSDKNAKKSIFRTPFFWEELIFMIKSDWNTLYFVKIGSVTVQPGTKYLCAETYN